MPDVLRFLPVLPPPESFRSRTFGGLSAGRRHSTSQIFVVEGGRAGLKKMPLAVGDRDALIPEASPDFFARSATAKFLVAESFSVIMSVWENPHAGISMLQFYFRNGKSQ